MIFDYSLAKPDNQFIEAYYIMKLEREDLPFSNFIIPNGTCHIRKVISSKKSEVNINKQLHELNGLTVNGPIYGAYPLNLDEEIYAIGIALKPVALYELTGKDVFTVYNRIKKLDSFCKDLHFLLNPVFEHYSFDSEEFKIAINSALKNMEGKKSERLNQINQAIGMIQESEGLIKIEEIIEEIPVSRKTIENQFKKMVGITIGRYIRQYRFLSLISKYKKDEIDYYEMMYKYNYYDASHFIKDFQFFTLHSPKVYFKKDYQIIEKYLFK